MKIFGGDLTEIEKCRWRIGIFGAITVVAIITAVLSSFMLTESGTKEYNWWVFLMVITWLAVGGSAAATGFAIKGHYDLTKNPGASANQSVEKPAVPQTTTQPAAE